MPFLQDQAELSFIGNSDFVVPVMPIMDTKETKKHVHVAIALIVDGDQFLVAKRTGNRHLSGFWELPGGKIESGESPVHACIREVREELGCEIGVDSYFMTHEHEYEDRVVTLEIFLCHLLDGETVHNLEHAEVRFITINEMDRLEFAPANMYFMKNIKDLVFSMKRNQQRHAEYSNNALVIHA